MVIGTPIAGRTDRALDRVVGMFVNTLVLRTAFDPAATVTEALAVARRIDLDAFAYSRCSSTNWSTCFVPDRPTAYSPLFQIALTYTSGDLEIFDAARTVGSRAEVT